MVGLLWGCIALTSVAAYTLRYQCSGPNLGYGLFCVCFLFNIFFVTYYMRVIETSYFLFIGHYPEFVRGDAEVNLACMVGVLLHCGGLPSKSKPKKFIFF